MSTYNDYMVKAATGFVELTNLYCNRLQLGIDDCCMKNAINTIGMYLDAIPRMYVGNCVDSEDVVGITNHINDLLHNWTLGELNGTDIIIPAGITTTATITASDSNSYAWNTTIGIAPIVVDFGKTLGNTGSSYSITYIVYSSEGYVVDVHITSRTASGFVVSADEDNVHFEGVATQIV